MENERCRERERERERGGDYSFKSLSKQRGRHDQATDGNGQLSDTLKTRMYKRCFEYNFTNACHGVVEWKQDEKERGRETREMPRGMGEFGLKYFGSVLWVNPFL